MKYGKQLNPECSLRTPKGIKGTRQKVIVIHNPSEIDQAQELLAAALFYRTQDTHRTQDSGHRTTGPGPDLNILIFRERFHPLLTVAIIK